MKRILILIIVLIIGIGAAIGLIYFSNLQKPQENAISTSQDEPVPVVSGPMAITFSHNNTFYDSAIEVEINCVDKEAKIYYTTDGTTPDKDATLYKGAISIAAGNVVKAQTLKVIAIDGEEKSDIVTKSYITGKDVFNRFSEDTYVFVLSTDPYNLYDYNYGVAVPGAVRDEYLNSDEYNGGEIEYNAPANWYISGRESERDMYVEAYNSAGVQLINQAAGGRVVGGYSRATEQKSWRLIARNEYSEGNGMFSYPFFTGAADAYGQLITKYDRITLRNNANDREFASVRDEIALQLSDNAGFPDTQKTHPAAVFLNSEYYGFAWLHEAYCNGYLEETYGGNKDNFRIVSGKENEVEGDDEKCVSDYQYLYDLAKGGLTDEATFKEFCELVDIDNLMLYYAIQIYIDNKDWPGNNFRAWRYYPSEDEEVTSEYLDGKWRFMLFDVEYAMSLYGSGYSALTLSDVLSGKHMQGASEILKAVLERKDMQEKFANTMCDLMYGPFSYENALPVIQEKIQLCDKECFYALDNGYTSTWANRGTFDDSRQQIISFFQHRDKIMLADLSSTMEIEKETYNITLENTDGGRTYLNSQSLKNAGSMSVDYFNVYNVPIKAEPYSTYEFDHWEINGVSYSEQNMNVTPSMADESGKVNIRAVYTKLKELNEPLYISELYTAGNGDWFKLYNPNDAEASTKDYYLSDDLLELNKWKIPSAAISANSALTIVCKNNTENSALHKLVTNFNLKEGETLFLSDINGTIISQAEVVDMNKNEYLVRELDGSYSIKGLPNE